MALVYPVELAARSTTLALARGLFWFGAVFITADIITLLFITFDRGSTVAIAPIIALVTLLATGVVMRSSLGGNRLWQYATLVVSIGSISVVAANLVPRIDPSQPSDTIVLSLAKVAIITFGVVAGRHVNPLIACAASLCVAEVPVTIVTLASGHQYSVDVATLTTFGIAFLTIAFLDYTRARTRASSAGIAQASDEDRRATELDRWARSSSALVHDTVLNELTVIATIAPGELSAAARERIGRSVALVSEPAAVIAATATAAGEQRGTGSQIGAASPLAVVIHDATERGLDVVINGTTAALDLLGDETTAAVVMAVGQCLENVSRHSGVRSAELTVLETETGVCVLVIDAGVGFDESLVAGDRLGLRNSVRRRIVEIGGRVDVWSAAGAGTSISILVPRS